MKQYFDWWPNGNDSDPYSLTRLVVTAFQHIQSTVGLWYCDVVFGTVYWFGNFIACAAILALQQPEASITPVPTKSQVFAEKALQVTLCSDWVYFLFPLLYTARNMRNVYYGFIIVIGL